MNPQTSTNKVLYDYFCSKKNKIKWTGSLEDLKAFVLTEINEETAEKTNWRSPSGGTWVFDSEPLFVTWHSKSKNIGFDGERGKDLTERVHSYLLTKNDTGLESANAVQSDKENRVETSLADDSNELSEDNSKDPGNVNSIASAEEFVEGEQDEEDFKNQQRDDEEAIFHSKNSNEDTIKNLMSEKLHKLPKAYTQGTTQSDYDYDSEIGMLKLKFESFADNVTTKLTDLTDEMRSIKENKPYSIIVLEGVIDELKNDKAELCKNNELLKNENIDMLHTIANLNTKLNALENEKQAC